MVVEKIGATMSYGCYQGYFHCDVWKCPRCGKRVLVPADVEVFDPEFRPEYDFREEMVRDVVDSSEH